MRTLLDDISLHLESLRWVADLDEDLIFSYYQDALLFETSGNNSAYINDQDFRVFMTLKMRALT